MKKKMKLKNGIKNEKSEKKRFLNMKERKKKVK